MNKNKKHRQKYIPLKEAAKISGYSSDYIGYLIRSGEIPGKPVYTNITWQTTAEAILSYKNRERRRKKKLSFKEEVLETLSHIKRKVVWEIKASKLFIKTFRFVLPLIIILILGFSILMFYIFSIGFKDIGQEERVSEPTVPLTY